MLESTKKILEQCGLEASGFRMSENGEVTGGCPKEEQDALYCAEYMAQCVLQRTNTPNMNVKRVVTSSKPKKRAQR